MGAQEGPVEPPRIGGSAGREEAQDYVVRGQSCEVIGVVLFLSYQTG